MKIVIGISSFLLGIFVDAFIYPKLPHIVVSITYLEIFFMACIFLYLCIVAYKKLTPSKYVLYLTIHVAYYWLSSHFYYEFFVKGNI